MKQIFITANRVKAEICRKLAGIGKKRYICNRKRGKNLPIEEANYHGFTTNLHFFF